MFTSAKIRTASRVTLVFVSVIFILAPHNAELVGYATVLCNAGFLVLDRIGEMMK